VYVCILALVFWQANRIFLRRAVPPVAYLAVGFTVFFSHYLKKGKIFEKKIEYKICVLILSTNFVRNISQSMKNSVIYDHKYTVLHVK
jgi:hypothetical protein